MKRSSFYKYFAPMALLVGLVTSGLFFTSTSGAHDSGDSLVSSNAVQTDPSSSLSRGRALLKRGRADQALSLLQSALSAFTQANNARGIAAAEDALGDLYMVQGQYKVALDHYQKAHQAFATAAQKDQTNQAATSSVAGLAGSTAGAATQTAGTIGADNGFNANLMLAKIGDTNYRLGQMTEAGAAYNMMTVKKPEKKSSRFGLGNPVSTIMGGGKPTVAPTSVAGALSEVTKEFEEYRAAIVYMTYELGLGRIAFAGNDPETARKHFQGALDAGKSGFAAAAKMGQTKRFRVAARTSLGDVALRQNRYSDAMSAFNDAVKGAKEDNRLDLMWSAQRGLGRSQWLQAAQEKDAKKASSLRESALSNYREGLATIETLRAGSLRADESRTTFLATTKDVYDEASSLFAEMALLASSTPGSALSGKALEYATESFRITEAGRARSLLDMLGEVNAEITEGVPAELLKRKQDNLDRQQQIAEQLTGIVVAGDQKQKPSELEGELDKLQTEFDQIENQIRTASPKYAALTAAQPLALAEVQQKVLDDGTVLVEYLLGKDSSYAFAVTQSGVSLFKLPRRTDVEKLATDFRAQLIPAKLQRRIVGIDVAADQQRGLGIVQGPSEDLPPFVAASNALYKAVVEPAASIIADKRVLVVADGALNYIPFEALVKNSEGADYASLNYFVKTNQIVYSPSASVIAAIRGSGGGASGKSILLVADPVFSADDPRAKGSAAATSSSGETRGLGLGLEAAVNDIAGSAGTGKLARLPGTRTEAEEISKIAKGGGAQADLWTDLNANEDNVRTRDLSSYRYLHIATHGLLDAERPQFTGVVLSLVGNKANDGFLRTDEIFNLKLGRPLVMLSACETGLGKEKRGEGVIGLTRAFMYAGAPTVGVSLWSVADKSTAELMTDFYKRMLTGSSPAASMRAAQVAMIAGKKYSAPFYWAPFVLVGEWK